MKTSQALYHDANMDNRLGNLDAVIVDAAYGRGLDELAGIYRQVSLRNIMHIFCCLVLTAN